MDDWVKTLQLVAENLLGDSVDKSSPIKIAVFEALRNRGYINAIDASTFDGKLYINPQITLDGHEYLRNRLSESEHVLDDISPIVAPKRGAVAAEPVRLSSQDAKSEHERIRVFISHSSNDRDVAAKLVRLLRDALGLPSADIRCTSVAGSRLAPSSSVESQLNAEVFDSDVFIALLTDSALDSTFTMFELGARWGHRKPIFPVVCHGLKFPLPPPLYNTHGCDAQVDDDLHELVVEIARHLGLTIQKPTAYSVALKELTHVAGSRPMKTVTVQNADDQVARLSAFDAEEKLVLAAFIDLGVSTLPWTALERAGNPRSIASALKRLAARGFVHSSDQDYGSSELFHMDARTFRALSEDPSTIGSSAPSRRFAN
jgi:hypothetical protein